MAISFVSKPLTSTDYVSPIDQSLVMGALISKQSQYNQNTSQVDKALAAFEAQPIYNEAHKAYYDQKLSDYKNKLNAMGGADFGDRQVMQQIGSLSSELTKDPRVIQAIADSKKIEKAKTQNELWKSDKKKYAGMWSAQNEYDLDKSISSYSKDTAPTASFTGEATPFFDHGKLMSDKLTSIQKQLMLTKQYREPDGHYITSYSELTPEKIRSIVAAEMGSDPQFTNQLRIDAQYQYKNYGDKDLQSLVGTQLGYQKEQTAREKENYLKSSAANLALITGSKQQRALAADRHKQVLAQYDNLLGTPSKLGSYDQQRVSLMSIPKDQLARKLHEDLYINKYQNEYAYRSEDRKFDPTYTANLNHQEFGMNYNQKAAMFNVEAGLKERQFQQDRQEHIDDMAYKYEALKAKDKEESVKKAQDLYKGTGMGMNPDGSASMVSNENIAIVDQGAVITPTTLGDLSGKLSRRASEQNGIIRNLITEVASHSDASLGDKLRNGGNFADRLKSSTQRVDKNGDAIREVFKRDTFTPKEVNILSQVHQQYHNLMTGQPVDESFQRNLSEDGKKLFKQLEQGARALQLDRKSYTEQETLVIKASGMSKEQLKQLGTLQQLKQTNPEKFTEQHLEHGIVYQSPQLRELTNLESQWNTVKDKVAAANALNPQGSYTLAGLITGESAKPDSKAMQFLGYTLSQKRMMPDGKTSAALADLEPKLKGATIKEAVVDYQNHSVSFDAYQPIKGKDDQYLGKQTVNLSDKEWLQFLPHVQQQASAISPIKQTLVDELERTGKSSMPYHALPSNGPAMKFFLSKKPGGGGYNLSYDYQGSRIPMPLRTATGAPLLDNGFQTDPIGFMDSNLDNFTSQLAQALRVRYGKGDPTYKPTIHDFHEYFSSPSFSK